MKFWDPLHISGTVEVHSDILAMCCKVISSFLIFAVLDLREAEVVLKRRFKLLSFFTIIIIISEHELSVIARPSVCLSVVCNVHVPYSGNLNFLQCFYTICYLGHL